MSFVIVDAPQFRRINSVAVYAGVEVLLILSVEYIEKMKNK